MRPASPPRPFSLLTHLLASKSLESLRHQVLDIIAAQTSATSPAYSSAIAARFVPAVLQLCHSTPRQLCSASASIHFHSFQYQSVPRFICRFKVVAVAAVPLFRPSSDEHATSYHLLTTTRTLSTIPLSIQTIIPSCSPFIVRLSTRLPLHTSLTRGVHRPLARPLFFWLSNPSLLAQQQSINGQRASSIDSRERSSTASLLLACSPTLSHSSATQLAPSSLARSLSWLATPTRASWAPRGLQPQLRTVAVPLSRQSAPRTSRRLLGAPPTMQQALWCLQSIRPM